MRKYSLIILAVFFLATTGCDFIYGLLQKEGAEEKALVGEVIPFEPNPRVIEIQKLLKLYGYKAGRADGGLGVNTRMAIEKFQQDNGLKVTKFVDKATWAKLNVFKGRQLVVDGEINIMAVQVALKNAGFSAGKPDGKDGPKTQEAIKKFQKAMGLNPDGRIGFKTLSELYDFLPAPVSAPAKNR